MRRLDTKKAREDFRNYQIEQLKEKHNAKTQNVYDLIIVTYESDMRGKAVPCLHIFKGTGSKPIANFWYTSAENRQKSIDTFIESAEARIAAKEARKREKKQFKPTLKVGDILYTSWGYDQTNVDFFQVIEAKGHFVKIREIESKQVDGSQGGMCCNVVAVKDAFLEKSKPMRKKVGENNRVRIHESANAYLWDGSECYSSWYA